MTLTTRDIAEIRELRYRDGLTQEETAKQVGRDKVTVWRYAPGRPGKIPNAPLREAFLASGLSASEVARRVGWSKDGWVDASRVRRTLGLTDDRGVKGYRSRRAMIAAETAANLAEAIGVMPWEVGA